MVTRITRVPVREQPAGDKDSTGIERNVSRCSDVDHSGRRSTSLRTSVYEQLPSGGALPGYIPLTLVEGSTTTNQTQCVVKGRTNQVAATVASERRLGGTG